MHCVYLYEWFSPLTNINLAIDVTITRESSLMGGVYLFLDLHLKIIIAFTLAYRGLLFRKHRLTTLGTTTLLIQWLYVAL